MKIIGHRGARGLALENSLESIRAAIRAGVDAIEFDVRLSSDGKFFLSHDASLDRVSGESLSIKRSTSREVKQVLMYNGEAVASLLEALEARDNTEAIIEAKGNNWSKLLAQFIRQYDSKNITVISFNHQELLKFHEELPLIPTFAIERTKAFEAIQFAKRHKLTGIDLNFWLLNPFVYLYARYYKLEIITYTINNQLIAWYFNMFFPRVAITTDVPQIMQKLRK